MIGHPTATLASCSLMPSRLPGYEFFKKVNVAARLYSFRKNGYLATAT